MKPRAYVMRPHPTKNKMIVTPCTSLTQVNKLIQKLKDQGVEPSVKFSRKNISSGEDYVSA